MKKISLFIILIICVIFSSAGVFAEAPDAGIELSEYKDADEAIKAEIAMGYTLEDPLVILDPYGTAPLSALIAFDTEEPCEVRLNVKGHAPEDDITAVFEPETRHILPVYGLYSGEENHVELTCGGKTKEVTIRTDPLDITYTASKVTLMDESRYDYGKLTFISAPSAGNSSAYDSKGELRWFSLFRGMPFFRLKNGHFLSETLESSGPENYNFGKGMAEIDLMGRVYNRYFVEPANVHHDALELENGNLIICTGHDDPSVRYDKVIEIDRATGKSVWELDLCELLDPTDGGGFSQTPQNWFHNDAIAYDETNDLLLLSGRNTDSVVAVKKATKEIAWILGDPEGWTKTDPALFFTPVGEGFEWPYAQHNVSVFGGNNILIFDNGDVRAKAVRPEKQLPPEERYSRAVMYRIDPENMTIEQIWQYGKERGKSWYTSYQSNVVYDPETDSFWIDAGWIQPDPEHPDEVEFFESLHSGKEIDPTDYNNLDAVTLIDHVIGNEPVFELKLYRQTYRCERYSFYADENPNYDLNADSRGFTTK